jgi:hypothetical protein
MKLATALRYARHLHAGEWGMLAAACVLQLTFRLLLPVWPLPRIVAWLPFRSRIAATGITPERLEQIVRWSTRLCRGTCLTESLVLGALGARYGPTRPVTIGVRGSGKGFRAHAWTGDTAPEGFTALWSSHDRRQP